MACFTHSTVPRGLSSDLIDHRYFYHLDLPNTPGAYTCGVARNAVADQIFDIVINFADAHFLTSLDDFIDNISVTEFWLSHTVLSSIRLNGLAIGENMKKGVELRVLTDPSDLKTDVKNKPVLYHPEKFNFKAIDGIILSIQSDEQRVDGSATNTNMKKEKLLVLPLQLALTQAPQPSSREMFFEDYGDWIADISNSFDIEVHFLWIDQISKRIREYQADPDGNWPKHTERSIRLKDINPEVWEEYRAAQDATDEE